MNHKFYESQNIKYIFCEETLSNHFIILCISLSCFKTYLCHHWISKNNWDKFISKNNSTKSRKVLMQYINKNLKCLCCLFFHISSKKAVNNCGNHFLFYQICYFHYQDVQIFVISLSCSLSFNLLSFGVLALT